MASNGDLCILRSALRDDQERTNLFRVYGKRVVPGTGKQAEDGRRQKDHENDKVLPCNRLIGCKVRMVKGAEKPDKEQGSEEMCLNVDCAYMRVNDTGIVSRHSREWNTDLSRYADLCRCHYSVSFQSPSDEMESSHTSKDRVSTSPPAVLSASRPRIKSNSICCGQDEVVSPPVGVHSPPVSR